MVPAAVGGRRPSRTRRALTSALGALVTLSGAVMLVGAAIEAGQASADTAPFELYCTGTPVGAIAFNDVVVTGSLSPAAPTAGQQFTLDDFQAQVTIPASVVELASEVGNTSLSGTATVGISATGATPSTMSSGALAYAAPIPNPVPSTGLQFDVPTTPATIGPFTATSSNVALSIGSAITLTFSDIALPGFPPFSCSAYPNDVVPSGLTNQLPPGLPTSPVIAYAGTPPPPPATAGLTGPYELYCPGTPVGDLDFNDVTTSATVTPSSPSAGGQFQVTGYQVQIPVPPGPVSSAVGLSNNSFVGLATTALDAYGASPQQVPTGSLGFDVAIPDPVPSSGVDVDLPTDPTTVGPFTADGGPVTIAQDESVLVVAKLSGKAFRMSCTAYPNDSLASSGSTIVPPPGTPIRPIVAMATASGTPVSTTTTLPGGPGGTTPAGSPYELYCPGSPVGDIAVNDVESTASITPSTLNEGDSFQVTGAQTQFTIPQGIAQDLENLGLTSLSGDLTLFLDVQGADFPGYPYGSGGGGTSGGSTSTTSVTASTIASTSGSSPPTTSGDSATTTVPAGSSGGGVAVPIPYPPYGPGGVLELSFDVTLPSPVPATGIQFTATPSANSFLQTYYAAGGPISALVTGANLDVSAFNYQFGLFCNTLTNDSVPTGLSINEPYNDLTRPIVATGSAAIVPPAPGPPGAYELYCPGTPVGNIVLNDVMTAATIPQTLASGQSFDVTGYQTAVNLPASIVSAASALGNTDITGDAKATLDVTGASPSTLSTGPLAFDFAIPSPIPSTGSTLDVPAAPVSLGPFTAAGNAVVVSESSQFSLSLNISGNALVLSCTAYPDNSLPSGITGISPGTAPISPVIATSGPTMIVSPSTGLMNGQGVTVFSSGDKPNAEGNILECNTASGEPTVALGAPVSHDLPVGCTAPSYAPNTLVSTTAEGSFTKTYVVTAGTVGPPCGAGDMISSCPSTDSAGNDPATDAAAYPCPPTPAQVAAGATCQLEFGDTAGDSESSTVYFSGQTPPIPPPQPGSGTYELYCPGTPVGNISLNGVTTSGTLSPADPSPGDQFQVTGYQTTVTLPAGIVSAAAALGNTALSGTATTEVDASGATPATTDNTFSFDIPIPNPVPSTGVSFSIPSPATTLGPFTATGGPITISENTKTQLTLVVSGNQLSLTCTAYVDDAVPSGITSSPPSGPSEAPTIATSSQTTTSTTTTLPSGTTSTTVPPGTSSTTTTLPDTSTTVAPTTSTTAASDSSSTTTSTLPSGSTTTTSGYGSTTTTSGSGGTTTSGAGGPGTTNGPATRSGGSDTVTANSGSLAFTGPGARLTLTAAIGAALLLLGLILLVVADVPARLRRRLAVAQSRTGARHAGRR